VNSYLLAGHIRNAERLIYPDAAGQLAGLDAPVRLIFGGRDRYLSPDLARDLAGLVGSDDLHVVDGASHWPQWDQPQQVAELLDG
jgi:haloalkane dehalogenase